MDLGNLLKTLLEQRFDFVVIGGFAATIHGSSLVTKDLDICMKLSSANISNLRQLLKDANPIHRMTPQKLSFLTYPEDLGGIHNLYLSSKLGSLDILSEVIGVGDFERVKSRSLEIPLFGFPCRVISIDDLIVSKAALGRDKDKRVIQELNVVKKL